MPCAGKGAGGAGRSWDTAPSPPGAREQRCHLPRHPRVNCPAPGAVLGAEPSEGCQAPAPGPHPAHSLGEGGVARRWPPLRCVCHDRSQLRPLRSPIKRRAPRPEPLLGPAAPEEPGCSARAGTEAPTQSRPPPPPPPLGRKGSSQCSPQGWRSQIRLEPEPRPRQAWSPWSTVLAVPAQPLHVAGPEAPVPAGDVPDRAQIPDKRHRALQPGKGGGREAVTMLWRRQPWDKGSAMPFPFPSAQVPALLHSGAPQLGLRGHQGREEGRGSGCSSGRREPAGGPCCERDSSSSQPHPPAPSRPRLLSLLLRAGCEHRLLPGPVSHCWASVTSLSQCHTPEPVSHPCKCSWTHRSNGARGTCPCPWQGDGIGWYLRSLPTLTILGFYGPPMDTACQSRIYSVSPLENSGTSPKLYSCKC